MEYPSLILTLPQPLPLAQLQGKLSLHLEIPAYTGSEHPDVQVISPLEKKTTIAIQQVRELLARTSFHPVFAPKTSIIFFPAESLSLPAQQSLLKILEEPPARTQFLLITHSPYSLLPTILSRCVIRPLITDAVADQDILKNFPKTIGEALKASDTYTTRDAAVAYIQALINSLCALPTRGERENHLLSAASTALSLLKKNCNVKLVLDTFFFRVIEGEL